MLATHESVLKQAIVSSLASSCAGVSCTITHYSFDCPAADRLLVVLALLKLGLVRKKVLLFVNTVDQV